MNFFEAYLEAKNGKKVTIVGCKIWWLQFHNEDYKALDIYNDKGLVDDEISPIQLAHWLDCEWQIHEEPKEKPGPMGLWHSERDPDGVEDLHTKHYVSCRNYVISSQHDAWSAALETFMRLKGHPLAVKPNNDETHFFIRIREEKLMIDSYECLPNKLTEVSAPFDSVDDGKQAIKDIGEDNLLHMFKTFQGIYE